MTQKTLWVTVWSHAYGLNIDLHPTKESAQRLEIDVLRRNPNVNDFTTQEKLIP